jgi:hypothetical protein
MTGILSPAVPPAYLARVPRRCRSPKISSRLVISIRPVSGNRSA